MNSKNNSAVYFNDYSGEKPMCYQNNGFVEGNAPGSSASVKRSFSSEANKENQHPHTKRTRTNEEDFTEDAESDDEEEDEESVSLNEDPTNPFKVSQEYFQQNLKMDVFPMNRQAQNQQMNAINEFRNNLPGSSNDLLAYNLPNNFPVKQENVYQQNCNVDGSFPFFPPISSNLSGQMDYGLSFPNMTSIAGVQQQPHQQQPHQQQPHQQQLQQQLQTTQSPYHNFQFTNILAFTNNTFINNDSQSNELFHNLKQLTSTPATVRPFHQSSLNNLAPNISAIRSQHQPEYNPNFSNDSGLDGSMLGVPAIMNNNYNSSTSGSSGTIKSSNSSDENKTEFDLERTKILGNPEELFGEVPGRMALLNNTHKYNVTYGEICRRINAPECLNLSFLGRILRKAKNKNGGSELRQKLKLFGVNLAPGRRKSSRGTVFSSLCEGEAIQIAEDFKTVLNEIWYTETFGKLLAENSSQLHVDYKRRLDSCLIVLNIMQDAVDFLAKAERNAFKINQPNILPGTQNNSEIVENSIITFSRLTHGFGNHAILTSWNLFSAILSYMATEMSLQMKNDPSHNLEANEVERSFNEGMNLFKQRVAESEMREKQLQMERQL